MSINEAKHYNLLIFVFNVQYYVIRQPTRKEDVEIILVGCVVVLKTRVVQPLLKQMSTFS